MIGDATTSPPLTNGWRPNDSLGVQIVTLLDFTGPLSTEDIGLALWVSDELVRPVLQRLMRSGHVQFSRNVFAAYESSGFFDPDRDGKAGGYATGPHVPKRHHGDGARLLPGLEGEP